MRLYMTPIRSLRWWLTGCVILVAVYALGCSDSGGIGNEKPNGPDACITSDDCPVGYQCLGGFCTESQTDGDEEITEVEDDTNDMEPDKTPQPTITAPDELNLGAALLGATVLKNFVVINSGEENLVITGAAFESGGTDEFTFTTPPQGDVELAPQESVTWTISYTPVNAGIDEAWFAIDSNDPDVPTHRIRVYSEYKGTVSIAVSPSSIDFGSIVVAKSDRRALTIANERIGDNDNKLLIIDALSIEPAGQSAFGIDFDNQELPLLIPPGEDRTVYALFNPMTETTFGATVVIGSNDPDEADRRIEVGLSGKGVLPHLTVNPDPIGFGNLKIGETGTIDVHVSNSGEAPLIITGVSLSENTHAFFTITSMPEIPQTGFILAWNETFTATLSYAPTTTGDHTGMLDILSNSAEGSSRSVDISGAGIDSQLIVDPTAVDFGDVRVNTVSDIMRVTVTNDGEAEATISGLSWTQAEQSLFSAVIAPALPATLGTGDSLVIDLSYAPDTESDTADQETLTLLTDSTGSDPQIGLMGRGVEAHIAASPADMLDFGEVVMGTGGELEVAISNTGQYDLTISALAISQGSSPDFSVDPETMEQPLAPGTAIVATVTYAPPAAGIAGEDLGSLLIASDDPEIPSYSIALRGVAVKPLISANPRPMDFGAVVFFDACTGTRELQLSNIGSGRLIIDDIVLYNASQGQNSSFLLENLPETWPLILPACGDDPENCIRTLSVRFDPDNVGDHTDSIVVASNAFNDRNFTLQLSGEGYLCSAAEHVCNCACAANNNVAHCGDRCETCPQGPDHSIPTCEFKSGLQQYACDWECEFPYIEVNGQCVPGTHDCCGANCIDCTQNPDLPPNADGVCTFRNGDYVCDYVCNTNYHKCANSDFWWCYGNNDAQHCGPLCDSCAAPDNANGICTDNSCSFECTGSWFDCDRAAFNGCEANLATDINTCGDCDTACQAPDNATPLCSNRVCSWSCNEGYHQCGEQCFVNSDADHCGPDCSTCPEGPQGDRVCIYDSGVGHNVCDFRCTTGWDDCNGQPGCETSIYTDTDNCGSCNHVCTTDVANADTTCVNGGCSFTCFEGTHYCSGDNSCMDNLDPDYCGPNCLTCPARPHSSRTCLSGACGIECLDNYANCDGGIENGCEIFLPTNVLNCGACNHVCSAPANGKPVCSNNTCDFNCLPGFHRVGDLCERNSVVECCGDACVSCTSGVNSTAVCTWSDAGSDFVCGCECTGGWGNCDSACYNGCETPLDTVVNCGECRNECTVTADMHANPACDAAGCGFTCLADWADCNSGSADGCEIHTPDNVQHCGSCNHACSAPANATAFCADNACDFTCNQGYHRQDDQCARNSDITCCGDACTACAAGDNAEAVCQWNDGQGDYVCGCTCSDGYGNCDSACGNGCETDLNTPATCGACDNRCTVPEGSHASAVCDNRQCDYQCWPDWDSCDSIDDNGCETHLPTSTDNCGICGQTCTAPANATALCADNACDFTCNSGFHRCGDLCYPNTDPAHCGDTCTECPVPANAAATCPDGSCGFTCLDGYRDCDGGSAGCEAHILTDENNCGGCFITCTPPANADPWCNGGSCDFTCRTGYHRCGSSCYPEADATHCGTTCVDCPERANANALCTDGACGFECWVDYDNCNGGAADGCEVYLPTSVLHCGGCNNACTAPANGTAICTGNSCDFTCNTGFHREGDACIANGNVDCCGVGCQTCTVPVGSHATAACVYSSTAGDFVCSFECNAPWADCNASAVDWCETDTSLSTAHCLACNNVCPVPANGSAVCTATGCDIVCDINYHRCGNQCRANSDISYCGAACEDCTQNLHNNDQAACIAGSCSYSCVTGYSDCNSDIGTPAGDGCESNLDSPLTCHACATNCTLLDHIAVVDCVTGGCAINACEGGWGNCNTLVPDGCEMNLDTTVTHCGACNNNCGAKGHVTASHCADGLCEVDACVANWDDCNNSGADGCETDLGLTTSCGVCGNDCEAKSNVTAAHCDSGSCTVDTCDDDWGDCNASGADGCEQSLLADDNCGVCGRACDALPHVASGYCGSGSCVISQCDDGWGDCNGIPTDGCETDLTSATEHCGLCATDCGDLANSSAVHCADSVCVVDDCDYGWGNCNNLVADGCERNLLSSTAYCGNCSTDCSALANTNITHCSGGGCVIDECDAGWGNCLGGVGDGCETNLTSDANHCGSCSTNCAALPNVDAVRCVTGGCIIDSCDPGWGNCNGLVSDGCETNLNLNTNHCGTCSNDCSTLSQVGATHCSSGTCIIDDCNTNYENCDTNVSNGCETYTYNNTGNCGACGNNCDGLDNVQSTHCTAGSCVIDSCDSGYGNCDTSVNNGCETNTTTSTDNCGACGNDCDNLSNTQDTHCSASTCVIDNCTTPYSNCDGIASNGCEANTNTNPLHCGTCGNNCNTLPHVDTVGCSSGSCTISSCDTGYDHCDGSVANGCEVNHTLYPNACSNASIMMCVDDTNYICADQFDYTYTYVTDNSVWFYVNTGECDGVFSTSFDVHFELDVPSGIDYDIFVYSSCGVQIASSRSNPAPCTLTGTDECTCIKYSDSWGSSDDDTYWIEVRYNAGHSCDDLAGACSGDGCFGLTVVGKNGTSGCVGI